MQRRVMFAPSPVGVIRTIYRESRSGNISTRALNLKRMLPETSHHPGLSQPRSVYQARLARSTP